MEDILVGEIERLKAEVKKLDEDRVFWREESRRTREEVCRVRAQLERREGEVAILNGELKIAKMESAEVEAELYGEQRDEAREWARRRTPAAMCYFEQVGEWPKYAGVRTLPDGAGDGCALLDLRAAADVGARRGAHAADDRGV